ncbi:hypothetical protein AF72_07455 [Xylella taiwanensis]|uniref:Uncharacterized protein n=1 Tax=Xylella taiwanensis TaxID=1444770 RepID=Z9JJJ6_9GAMM|nr:hypothetical protein AB672_10505 [Xylella taiwanensis]EWS78143.1 hypothetical protein AF72_07455 [Xylella taiwanensis]
MHRNAKDITHTFQTSVRLDKRLLSTTDLLLLQTRLTLSNRRPLLTDDMTRRDLPTITPCVVDVGDQHPAASTAFTSQQRCNRHFSGVQPSHLPTPLHTYT